jgi:hypothetical protein
MSSHAFRFRDEDSNSYSYDSVWDANKIHGCLCDPSFGGYDCSEFLCPDGDDPLTTGQVNEIQYLRCIAISGSFALYFGGTVVSSNIPHTASKEDVEAALLATRIITSVTVTFSQDGPVCTPGE